MANEILLRFGTKNLEKAKAISKRIEQALKKSLRLVKDVKQRKSLRAFTKRKAKETRELFKKAESRQGLSRRIRARLRTGLSSGDSGEVFRRSSALGVENYGIAKGLLTGSRESIGSLLGKFSGQAAVVAQVSLVAIEFVTAEMEKQEKRIINRMEAYILAELEQRMDRLDIKKRLEEDSDFSLAQSANLAREVSVTREVELRPAGFLDL